MRYLVFICLLVSLLTGAPAFAQEQPIRVAVSPFVYFPAGTPFSMDEGRDAVVSGMEDLIANVGDDFELGSQALVQRRIREAPGYVQTVELARLRAELGISKYRELDPAAAAESLAVAQEQFWRADQPFVDASEVSETLLFRALALLDSGSSSVTGPLDVMKQMVLIDPAREVQEGAFPEEVVRFYRGARLELERDVREGGPGEAWPERLATLSAGTAADGAVVTTNYVLVANVLPAGPGAVELVVWLYDAAAEQFQVPASMMVTAPTPSRIGDAANRLASRLLACLVEPSAPVAEPIPRSSGQSPFALQLNVAYASYYEFPQVGGQDVEPFDNLGAGIGGALFLTREFALVATFQFLSSTTEYSGLVRPKFTTLRSFAGSEIGLGFGRFRVALGTLLEATGVGTITTCPGSEGVQDRRFCENPVELPPRFLFGLNARPRLSYRVLDSMQVFAGGSTSFYFVGGGSLNFLTAAEAGLQYRF